MEIASSSSSSDEESVTSDSSGSIERVSRRRLPESSSGNDQDSWKGSKHRPIVQSQDDSEESISDNDDESSKTTDASHDESVSAQDVVDPIDSSLPLAERIRRQVEQGVDLKPRRERKLQALKVATQRLAKMKQEMTGSKQTAKVKKKKKSKHAPTEASSKRADFFKHKTTLNESGIGVDIGAHRYKPRDPRVSSLHGHLDVDNFERNYGFLQEIREKEIAELQRRIAAWKTSGKKGQRKRRELGLTQPGASMENDQEELKRLLQEKADYERNQIDRAAKRAVKKKLQQQVAEGKHGVYFPKRRELKRMHLEAKFEEIRKRGGDRAVDKVVAKRRKKNKSRDAGLLGGG